MRNKFARCRHGLALVYYRRCAALLACWPDIDGQFAFSGVLSQNVLLVPILHYCAVWFCDEINVLSPSRRVAPLAVTPVCKAVGQSSGRRSRF